MPRKPQMNTPSNAAVPESGSLPRPVRHLKCADGRSNQTMEERMLAKHLTLALLGTALLAAPALTQTSQPAGSTAPASGTSTTAPASAQMNMGTWLTQEQPGQWRASKIRGLNVYNQSNEKIGDISELI